MCRHSWRSMHWGRQRPGGQAEEGIGSGQATGRDGNQAREHVTGRAFTEACSRGLQGPWGIGATSLLLSLSPPPVPHTPQVLAGQEQNCVWVLDPPAPRMMRSWQLKDCTTHSRLGLSLPEGRRPPALHCFVSNALCPAHDALPGPLRARTCTTQMELFGHSANKVVDDYSKEFEKCFLDHLKRA